MKTRLIITLLGILFHLNINAQNSDSIYKPPKTNTSKIDKYLEKNNDVVTQQFDLSANQDDSVKILNNPIVILFVIILFIIVFFVIIKSFRRNEPDKENISKSREDDNSKGLRLNSNGTIRTDGYYISKFEALSNINKKESIYFFIIFTRNGFVGLKEIEDINEWKMYNSDEDLRGLILETNKINEVKNPQNLAKYKFKKGQLQMKFYDPDENANDDVENLLVYDEWYGSVINNGLVLSFDMAYFNNALQDYVKENQIKNLKFQFKQINLN